MKKRISETINNAPELKIPLNLQFFAEGEGEVGEIKEGDPLPDAPTTDNPAKPSYEDLLIQLSEAKAEVLKQKNLKDKFSSEAAKANKQLQERLSAEEKADIAKQEAEAAKQAEDEEKDRRIAELESREKIRDCTEYLMDKDLEIAMDKKAAKDFAESFIEANFEKCMTILSRHIKAIKAEVMQKALDNRDPIHAGNGGGNENALAEERAKLSAQRTGGVNTDILKQYGGR